MDDLDLLLTTADVSAQEKTEEPSKDNTKPENAEVESSLGTEPRDRCF